MQHFREAEHYNKPPFKIISMHIGMDFSKARVGGILGNSLTAPMQGLLHSQSIGAPDIESMVRAFVKELNIRAIPSSGMIGESRKMRTELTAAGSTWQAVASLGRKNKHRISARTWRFAGSFMATGDVLARARASDVDDVLAIARLAFETAVPPDSHPSGIRFMTVFGNLQPLIDGEAGSVTVKVIRGYIQGTQTDA